MCNSDQLRVAYHEAGRGHLALGIAWDVGGVCAAMASAKCAVGEMIRLSLGSCLHESRKFNTGVS